MAKQLSFEDFSARVEKVYNGRISVVKETYINTKHKVTVYCNIHKIYFEVEEARNLTRHFVECPECKKEILKRNGIKHSKEWSKVLESFIKKYGNKFSYDESSYKNMGTDMIVHCNDCGQTFKITPVHHLKYINGGCPICHKHKTRKCSKCGRIFEVNHHYADSADFVCKECKDKEKRKHIKKKDYCRKTVSKKYKRTKEEQRQYDKIRTHIYKQNKDYICPCCGQIHKYKEKC